MTLYTIRQIMASETRKRGVSVWAITGLPSHSSGDKTTERYAKFGPDHLSEAIRAIDAYFADLGSAVNRLSSDHVATKLRASCVLASIPKLVEPVGLEPTTSTMPL